MDTWMAVKERGFISQHLTSETTMLEWGSGGSTLEFSKRVKSYFSIEHNEEWFNDVGVQLAEQGIENVERRLVPPGEDGFAYEDDLEYYDAIGYELESGLLNEWQRYREYINKPFEFRQGFDVILIDGRARRCCAVMATKLLKKDGVLFVHDYFKRPAYAKTISSYYNLVGSVEDTEQTLAKFKVNRIAVPTRGMF